MQFLSDYFLSNSTLPEKEQIDKEKKSADAAFKSAQTALFTALQVLTESDNRPKLASFIRENQAELDNAALDNKKNRDFLNMLPTKEDQKKYHDYVEARRIQEKAEIQLKAHENIDRYNEKKNTLQTRLAQNLPDEPTALKKAISELLKYIEKHPHLKSIPNLTKMIEALTPLLAPEDLDDYNRVTIRTQKINFDFLYLAYDYQFQSSRRYEEFARYIDKVPGARSVNTERLITKVLVPFMLTGLIMTAIFCILSLSLGSPLPLSIVLWGGLSLVSGIIALTLHLAQYSRTGLSKQLAMVADTALPVEEERLKAADIKRDNNQYTSHTLLNSPIKDESLKNLLDLPIVHVDTTYYNPQSPERGLRVLNRLDQVLKSDSMDDFNTNKNRLIEALQTQPPRNNRFSFLTAQKPMQEINQDISNLLDYVAKPLIAEEKNQRNKYFNSKL